MSATAQEALDAPTAPMLESAGGKKGETGAASPEGEVGGGAGSVLTRRNFIAIASAAKRGKLFTSSERRKSVDCCLAVLNDPKASDRLQFAAVLAIAAIESVCMEELHRFERLHHRLLVRRQLS
jgi:hypothetical protein